MKFIEHRVGDPRMVRLIQKWLKAGVSEEGQWSETKVGTPQGAVISPSPIPQSPERIAVRQNGRVLFIKLEEIDWIEAADNYVCLHCGVETHVLSSGATTM